MHLIAQVFTHPADLSVQSLSQNNAETVFSGFFNYTGTGNRIQNGNPMAHALYKIHSHRLIYGYQIFFLMPVTCAHNAVYNISFIGKEQKSLGILVQSSHRINPYGIIQVICYGYLISLLLRAAHNASWLIKKKQYLFFIFSYRNSVYTDHSIQSYFFSAYHGAAIHCHAACFDHTVCLSSGTDSCITDKFINSDFFVHFFIIYFFVSIINGEIVTVHSQCPARCFL